MLQFKCFLIIFFKQKKFTRKQFKLLAIVSCLFAKEPFDNIYRYKKGLISNQLDFLLRKEFYFSSNLN